MANEIMKKLYRIPPKVYSELQNRYEDSVVTGVAYDIVSTRLRRILTFEIRDQYEEN